MSTVLPTSYRHVKHCETMSRAQGTPESVAEATYLTMIAVSIDYERGEFTGLKGGQHAN